MQIEVTGGVNLGVFYGHGKYSQEVALINILFQ